MSKNLINRRDAIKTSALAVGGGLLLEQAHAYPRGVNTNSAPSTLKITDMRVATVAKPGPSPCPIIRIDTNQGVYGLGEVRDGASATYALFLKSRVGHSIDPRRLLVTGRQNVEDTWGEWVRLRRSHRYQFREGRRGVMFEFVVDANATLGHGKGR